jgi:PAS domain-containing protein
VTAAAPTVTESPATPANKRPPLWLIITTAAMAIVLLAMSVTETSLSGQYLIDQGEYLSLVGLGFILIAGLYLHQRGRLAASLPLVFPWLLYPVITQGDQIIDHLSITWMRVIVHALLAAIFGMPVAVIVYAAKWLRPLTPVQSRNLAIALLAAEIVLAQLFLGLLMIVTLLLMIAVVWWRGGRERRDDDRARGRQRATALAVLIAGVIGSAALYAGFKNRPGAYQGSPSYYMDPSQPGAGFVASASVPTGSPAWPDGRNSHLELALQGYAKTLETLLDGYYVLDRNYNYHFHNELFLRATPLVPSYRQVGLSSVDEARSMRRQADAHADQVALDASDPLQALLSDVRAFVAFNLDRAATLEQLSAEFEKTKAGLQHATHIYEGEGKYLGVQLAALVDKHRGVLSSARGQELFGNFIASASKIEEKYANRIVGF